MLNSLVEVKEELKNQKYFHEDLYKIVFKYPVTLQVNKYKKKDFKEVTVKLFVSSSDILAYTFHKRHGYPVYRYFHYLDIESIKKVEKEEKKIDRVHKAELLRKKIHKNLWPELRNKTAEELAEKDFGESSLNPVYYIKKFPKYRQEQISQAVKNAIENKEDYNTTYSTSHRMGRDLRIGIQMCNDGILRGWFSSEYMGCLNGDYYLILNEKIAVFCERD